MPTLSGVCATVLGALVPRGRRITHVQGYVWQLPERCVLVERQRRVNDWRSAQRDHGNSLGLGQRAARTSGHAAGRQNDEQNGDDLRARRREEHRHGAVGATISPMNQEVRRRSTPRAHPAVVSPRPDDAADRTSTCGPSCGPNRPLERVNPAYSAGSGVPLRGFEHRAAPRRRAGFGSIPGL